MESKISDFSNPQNPLAHSYLALKASAGSGKTFSLALRYIWLLFNGAKPSEILALTFTKKATKQMQERVQNALKEIANPNALSPFLEALQNLGLSKQEIRANSQKIYKEFLDSTPKICTIDAFFNAILHKFCWYVGLSQDYQMGENIDENELFEEFLAILAKTHSAKPLESADFATLGDAKTPNDFSHLSGVFSRLVRFCVDFEIDFGRVMSLLESWHNDKIHFNAIFLQQIKSYSLSEIKSSLQEVESSILSTLKLMQEILQKGGVSDRGANALQASSVAEFAKKSWTFLEKNEPNEYKDFSKPLKNEALNAEFCPHFFKLKENLKQYFLLKERAIFAEFATILDAYGRAKNASLQASKKLSFDSCALKIYELLILGENLNADFGGIDPQFFYFRMDNAISHILIDEFQDTSPMQYAILEPLIDEIYAGQGREVRGRGIHSANIGASGANNAEQNVEISNNRSVFFVGDSKQCIYGFRGSEAGFFDKIIKSSPLQKHNLPHNYRSKKAIIDFVNACFGRIFDNLLGEGEYQNQTLPNPQTTESSPKSTNQKTGFVCVVENPNTESSAQSSTESSTDFNAKSTPKTSKEFSQNDENQNTENEVITNILASLDTLFMHNINPNDIAILCFKNDDIFSISEAIKQRFSIKITPDIKSAFIQKPSVRFILSALKFILLDMQKLQDKTLLKSMDFYLYECLKINGKKAFEIPKDEQKNLLESCKNALKECLKKSIQNHAQDIANSTKMQSEQNKQESKNEQKTQSNEIFYKPSKCIFEIIKTFKIYDKNAQKLLEISLEKSGENIGEFIARVESQTITPPKENQIGLRILTIHAAKGLEFPYVILADRLGGDPQNKEQFIYENGVYFATSKQKRKIVDEEFAKAVESSEKKAEVEKNNVLYVACTRAQNGLMIVPKNEFYKSGDKAGQSKSAFRTILESIQTPFFAEKFGTLDSLKSLQEKAQNMPKANPPQSTKELQTPKILAQKPFGTQTQTLKKESALSVPNSIPNVANMRFGEALHLALEYALGFGAKKEILASLLQNHFGAQLDIERILMLVKKTTQNLKDFLQAPQILPNPQTSLQDFASAKNQQILVEMPLFFDGELKRIDLLVQNQNEIFIFDYKSGLASKDEHKKQVNGYVNALKTLYKDCQINGYVAYIRDDMVWEKC